MRRTVLLADRPRQFLQILLGEMLARIVGIGLEKLDRDVPEIAGILDDGFLRSIIADERRKAAAEPAFWCLGHTVRISSERISTSHHSGTHFGYESGQAARNSRSRRMISEASRI